MKEDKCYYLVWLNRDRTFVETCDSKTKVNDRLAELSTKLYVTEIVGVFKGQRLNLTKFLWYQVEE